MNVNACFKIAYVMKTHGLKGEVTLSLLPDCPPFEGVQSVFLELRSQLVPYIIQSASLKGTRAYVKLDGVNTPEGAEGLKGCPVYLPKDSRPLLSKGEFYSDEIVGFEVMDGEGIIGVVKEVLETGANRHLAIIRDGKEALIPVNGPFIKSINRSRKQIRVELPDGLLDL